MLRNVKFFLVACLFLTACHSINKLTVTDFKESVCRTNYPLNAKIQHVKDSLYRVHYYIVTNNLQKRISADGLSYQDFMIQIHAFQSFGKNKLLACDSVNYKNSLSAELPDTLFLSSDLLLPPTQNCAVELKLQDLNRHKNWEIVRSTIGSFHPNEQNLLITDESGKILFRNYLIENDPVIINCSDSSIQFKSRLPLPMNFPEPPFGLDREQKSLEQPIDIQPYICGSSFVPNFQGRLISNNDGVAISVFPEHYPELSEWDKINLLRYICTEQEFQLVKQEKNPTLAWALFISETKGSREVAQNKEMRFYESAKTANLLFTEDRFGWMTDRGMIFIVFGMPSKVIQSDGCQSWMYYNEDNPFESFQVDFMENETKNGYVLQRSESLRMAWFKAVENWRVR